MTKEGIGKRLGCPIEGRVGVSHCFTEDYGLTWAASIYDWEFAKQYKNEHE